ncbi:uncharacterized protein VTP21DRAFT_722 [Calcarisporiella thermophila]|uniref:uncharacterized protein n=1 Tax=Calcarisporiella thermophila TaxID=911321 RepID=UPI0037449DBA
MFTLFALFALVTLVNAQNLLSQALRSISNTQNSELNQQQLDAATSYARLASIAACSNFQPGKLFKESIDCSNTNLCTNFEEVKVIDKFDRSQTGDIGGFFGRDDKRKTLIIVFKGTSSVDNVKTDLLKTEIIHPDIAGAEVHKGFYVTAMKTKAYLFPKLQSEIADMGEIFIEYEVEVIGHSLGGAIATLITAELINHGQEVSQHFDDSKVALITLGQPRVGGEIFTQFMNNLPILQKRLTNRHDPIPFVPFKPELLKDSFLLEDFPNYKSRNFVIHAHTNGKFIHCISGTDPECEADQSALSKLGTELFELAKAAFQFNFNLESVDHFGFNGVKTGCTGQLSGRADVPLETTLMQELLMKLQEAQNQQSVPSDQ